MVENYQSQSGDLLNHTLTIAPIVKLFKNNKIFFCKLLEKLKKKGTELFSGVLLLIEPCGGHGPMGTPPSSLNPVLGVVLYVLPMYNAIVEGIPSDHY